MKRYIHKNSDHQYEIKRDTWGKWICRELKVDGYGSSLTMDSDQLFNFEGMLLKNGWQNILSKKA
jgi:hypothetical protein